MTTRKQFDAMQDLCQTLADAAQRMAEKYGVAVQGKKASATLVAGRKTVLKVKAKTT